MALKRIAPLTVLACALGCATYSQDDGPSSPDGAQGGSQDAGGTASRGESGGSSGTTAPSAGNHATSGNANTAVAGTASGGSFSSAGTFAASGTSGAAAGGKANGGSGGRGGDSNNGGSGGSVGGGASGCAAHPLPPKTSWTATASIEAGPCPGMPNPDYCGPAARAIDGLLTPMNLTRYTTGTARTGTEWLQIDFGTTVTLSQIVLTTAAGADYTHDFEVRVSADAAKIAASTAIISGMGQAEVTTITLPARTTGQFLRINQMSNGASWWSIQELDVSCQ
jgi:hypothetical protein